MSVHIHIRDLDFRDASPEDIKRLLMEDYTEKDRLVRSFHETGQYTGTKDKMTEFKARAVVCKVFVAA